MQFKILSPKVTLNKSYLKEKIGRKDIDLFKANLSALLRKINEDESEEHLKNTIIEFLKETWYRDIHEINTKGRNDLVIHVGKTTKESVGVILEVKRPGNKSEMITAAKPNVKAMHELILYYLRERVEHNNIDIKYLIATNIYEWFIIDATWFEKNVFRSLKLKKDYDNWKLSGNDTRFFYENIAKPFIDSFDDTIACTYFNLKDFEKIANDTISNDDNKLIPLFKILSPAHLLKQPFGNDSNYLDNKFYSELLHIIGLKEVKVKNTKIIIRKDVPDPASLLESTITKLKLKDCLRNIPNISTSFGSSIEVQYFNIALELCITWVNRIIFLKLLEAQLFEYHKKNTDYLFLNTDTIFDFDELNNLFFQVLSERPQNRNIDLKEKFSRVPYLNSSLFERTVLERQTIDIDSIDNRALLNLYSDTILKDVSGKKKNGKLTTLAYFFNFLDAYDFSSQGSTEIQEENKNLINASVLGLIFEKINGYTEGAFFTPGFVTMYICRETIRKAVIDKFNEKKGWSCRNIDELYNKIENKQDANYIIDNIKICDPAVGSGHFLVSALNEIIAIKNELKILMDKHGKTLRDYSIEVVNDELIITNEDGNLFEYSSSNKESQRVQETLFHEKETIIENCLFGVDINSNSAKICRLRLWIELLKHAYYTSETNFTELETLPNIDINIKNGNSLISRFELDDELKSAFRDINYSIQDYKQAVKDYKTVNDKERKKELLKIIDEIKNAFTATLDEAFKDKISGQRGKVVKIESEINTKKQWSEIIPKQLSDDLDKAQKALSKLQERKDEIIGNVIFINAFEWRFEFPEVLDDDDNFTGFDVIIGNPPYGNFVEENAKDYFRKKYQSAQGPFELYKFFMEKGFHLLNSNGYLCYISPDTWINLSYFKKIRAIIADNYSIQTCSETLYDVFDEATVDTNIYIIKKTVSVNNTFTLINAKLNEVGVGSIEKKENDTIISLKVKPDLIRIIEKDSFPLENIIDVLRGMSAYGAKNEDKPYNSQIKETEFHRPLLNGGDIAKYSIKWNGEFIKYGKWLHRPRPVYIYDRPHLLVQRIRNPRLKDRIIATYDDEKYISSDGLSNIILKDAGTDYQLLKAILAVINSKVINYWFSFYFFDVNIKPEQLRQIPIKKHIDQVKDSLSNLVDYILFLNKLKEDINEYVPNQHIILQFDEIIESIVYEMYLKSNFENEQIDIIKYAGSNFPDIFNLDDESKKLTVHNVYQNLRQKDNEIRNNLKLMDIRLSSILEPIKLLSNAANQ